MAGLQQRRRRVPPPKPLEIPPPAVDDITFVTDRAISETQVTIVTITSTVELEPSTTLQLDGATDLPTQTGEDHSTLLLTMTLTLTETSNPTQELSQTTTSTRTSTSRSKTKSTSLTPTTTVFSFPFSEPPETVTVIGPAKAAGTVTVTQPGDTLSTVTSTVNAPAGPSTTTFTTMRGTSSSDGRTSGAPESRTDAARATEPTQKTSLPSGLSSQTGAILIGVLGGLALLSLIIAAAIVISRRKKRKLAREAEVQQAMAEGFFRTPGGG